MADFPKLSVCMITYNHENFIAQAIESVLMQEVNFDYEIVIGEDCSTDNTRNILLSYHNKFPDKIKLILHEHNVGGHENFIQTYKACKGEYLALLEGDDFWISPEKLQMQVDLMEKHPEFATCFHRVVAAVQDGDEYRIMRSTHDDFYEASGKRHFTLKDFLDFNFIPTGSTLFRNNLIKEFPSWIYDVTQVDWALQILYAQHGDIILIDELIGAYRIHPNGVWTSRDRYERNIERIKILKCINKHLNYKYDKRMRTLISDTCYRIVNIACLRKDAGLMRRYLIKGFFEKPFNKRVKVTYLLKSFIIAFFPFTQELKKFLRELSRG